jgi:hypothetical protein
MAKSGGFVERLKNKKAAITVVQSSSGMWHIYERDDGEDKAFTFCGRSINKAGASVVRLATFNPEKKCGVCFDQ